MLLDEKQETRGQRAAAGPGPPALGLRGAAAGRDDDQGRPLRALRARRPSRSSAGRPRARPTCWWASGPGAADLGKKYEVTLRAGGEGGRRARLRPRPQAAARAAGLFAAHPAVGGQGARHPRADAPHRAHRATTRRSASTTCVVNRPLPATAFDLKLPEGRGRGQVSRRPSRLAGAFFKRAAHLVLLAGDARAARRFCVFCEHRAEGADEELDLAGCARVAEELAAGGRAGGEPDRRRAVPARRPRRDRAAIVAAHHFPLAHDPRLAGHAREGARGLGGGPGGRRP